MLSAKQIILLPGVQLLLVAAISAQYKFDKPVLLNKDNGLPVNYVRSISKDQKGFMWIGTSEGLCRFDGLQVKVFREGTDLKRSLFDNSVNAVIAVRDQVWVATDQGVSVMNTRNDTFKHYQFAGRKKADSLKRQFDQVVSYLYKDHLGRIWIGTQDRGAALYDESKDDFRFFTFPEGQYSHLTPSLGTSYTILSITSSANNDSVVWAGTTAGLQKINHFTGKTELYTFPQKSKDYQVALNAFRRLFHHTDGLLYVGSWGAGMNVFDPANGTFTPLEVKNEEGKKITRSVIGSINRKSDHELWISSVTGLAVYDTRLKDITWYKFNNTSTNQYYAVHFIDESDRVWFGGGNGLSYYDPVTQQFSMYSYKNSKDPEWNFAYYIIPDKTGNTLTVCPRMTGGLLFFDKRKKEWSKKNFPDGKVFLGERETVKGFAQISPGEYIISSDKGIFRYSEKKNSLAAVNPGVPFSPSRRGDILKDRDGNVWLSDDTWGLTKWIPGTDKYINYKDQTIGSDTTGRFNWLLHLFEDSRGNIWFQRHGGIGVYWAAKDSFLRFIYAKNENNSFPTVNSFTEDKKGRVWASSSDGWLGYALAAEPGRGLVHKLNTREKGIAGGFSMLAADTSGNIWGVNQKELVKITASDLSFVPYSFKYGVEDASFNHFSFLPTGEMVFGGRNEITIVNPAELKRNPEIPVPYITEIQVLNQPFGQLPDGEQLRLKHQQNFFSIGFSAKAYTLARDVKFRYRLKGFDDWSEPSDRHFANYTNVPGGNYVFQLQAANNEAVWNEKILELPVTIKTPVWQRGWFRAAGLFLLGFLVYSVYRYRVNQFRKKEKLKSEYEKKIANVEMSSLLAQMNPHFLFNSLNSIDSYIIRNESGKASEYLNNFARLMRLILQNSRSNYITLKDELEALELYMQMEGLRFQKKFEYSIKVDEGLDTSSLVIPPMLIQPYVENAIWHGLMHKDDGTKGRVEIILSADDHKLKCVVQDNGIGRGKAEEIKAMKTGNRKRSMGMQITRDRIEMINKLYGTRTTVEITDLVDREGNSAGTRVELTIPF